MRRQVTSGESHLAGPGVTWLLSGMFWSSHPAMLPSTPCPLRRTLGPCTFLLTEDYTRWMSVCCRVRIIGAENSGLSWQCEDILIYNERDWKGRIIARKNNGFVLLVSLWTISWTVVEQVLWPGGGTPNPSPEPYLTTLCQQPGSLYTHHMSFATFWWEIISSQNIIRLN